MDGLNHMEITARAATSKKPVPEIDFTLHTMEDGTQVSTQERVCKGKRCGNYRASLATDFPGQTFKLRHSNLQRKISFSQNMIAASPI